MTPAPTPTVFSWRTDAACRDMDTAKWFPERQDDGADAKAICSTCPVKAECIQYGLHHEMTGIFGGATEREREAMRSQRAISPQKPGNASFRGVPWRRR